MSENAVKAAFLFHFAQFTEWPAKTFKDDSDPLTFCTLGADPFHGELDRSLTGQIIRNHPVRLQRLMRITETQACQVIFVGGGEKNQVPALLASLGHSPVLTISETEGFAQEGGMIRLYREENKIRFEINLHSAEQADLRISAKLLALATAVIGGSARN